MPPPFPVKAMIAILLVVLVLAPLSAAAGSQAEPRIPSDKPVRTDLFEADAQHAELADISDPWEGWNRRVYAFNASFDRRLFLPTVRTYEAITPDPVEDSIWNFFQNVGEVKTLLHSILQLKPRTAGRTLRRLVVNSTLGLGGIFDPATNLGFRRYSEDFGQTLGRYGVPAGPYFVLPIFGPSNARDTTGMLGDYALTVVAYDAIGLNDSDLLPLRLTLAGLQGVSTRANTAFRYYETGSPFEYELVRYLYTQMRRLEIQQ